jgi:hypothetical protein
LLADPKEPTMGQAMNSGVTLDSLPVHDSPPLAGLLVPDGASDLAQTMAGRIMSFKPASDAEALKLLRAAFPSSSLSLRVAALAFLTRHQRTRSPYNPR